MTKTKRTCEFLKENGEQSLSDIAALLGGPRERARRMMRKLVKAGCVGKKKRDVMYSFVKMPSRKGQPKKLQVSSHVASE